MDWITVRATLISVVESEFVKHCIWIEWITQKLDEIDDAIIAHNFTDRNDNRSRLSRSSIIKSVGRCNSMTVCHTIGLYWMAALCSKPSK